MGGWMDSHFRLSVFLQSTERGRTGGIPTGDGYTRNDPSCARYRRRLERIVASIASVASSLSHSLNSFIHMTTTPDDGGEGDGWRVGYMSASAPATPLGTPTRRRRRTMTTKSAPGTPPRDTGTVATVASVAAVAAAAVATTKATTSSGVGVRRVAGEYSDRYVPSRSASAGFRGDFVMLEGGTEASASGRLAFPTITTVTTTTTRDGTTMNNANGTTTIVAHGGGGGGGGTGTTNGGDGEDGRGNRRTGGTRGEEAGHRGGGVSGNGGGHEREEASAAYGALLRSGLLGDASPPEAYGVTPPSTPSTARTTTTTTTTTTPSSSSPSFVVSTSYSSPGKNLFRFRADGSFGVARESPFTLSPVASLLENQPLSGGIFAQRRRAPRKISRSPFKVLDAPALQDDFYLNLVDWSSSNILAVGLGTSVYLWSACTSKVTKLCELAPQQDSVCSVAWTQRGTYLGVGTNSGEVQIWDVAKCKLTRTMRGHRSRAGTLAWNSHTISSGSRDRSILNRDVRSASDFSSKLLGHKSEVCGLKWSYDEGQLASGGNDNQLFVWNAHSTSPALRCSEHTAAVKAIAWSPHQHGLLASGGGTADRCIRFWNTVTNAPLQCVDTGSQVCNLEWSKNVNEIVSTHGYSQNQIVVWRYPSMSKLTTLTGHTYRVLYLAVSPDGQTIVTGAGDETLRFWNVFPGPKSQVSGSDNAVSSLARAGIR